MSILKRKVVLVILKIYAISDLHLSFIETPDPDNWQPELQYKPMSEINGEWESHALRIYHSWRKIVGPDDVVLVPGDISWAMRLEQAYPDFNFLRLLPGLIICVQGNHDYWWQSISKTRKSLPPNMRLIRNDHFSVGGTVICGTRGWLCPGSDCFQPEDMKIYLRELGRLEKSLASAGSSKQEIIVMMHYMPTNEKHEYSGFIELLQKYGVRKVVYGHLHAGACRFRLPDQAWEISFHLVSADYLNFAPRLLI